jgi:diguanylate cyclase (GGDEF)-like protein/putative nucleotidyltransferase with HDIG domain
VGGAVGRQSGGQAVTQQALADEARTPGLPDHAKAFLVGTGLAAAAVSVPAIQLGGETRGWAPFLVLAVGASIAQLFAFHTIRNQVFHTTPLFLVAGAMLLPPELLVLLPLISHIPDWLRKRYAWYIQTFNILNFTLAVMCAWGAARIAEHWMAGQNGGWAAGAAAAAATYVVLNNAGFAAILYLARGHSPREILNPQTIAADASLACLGIAFAFFWLADAWLVPFALVPIFLLHAALHLPQLQEEARVDSKTGLANARHFMEALREELTRARRFGRPLSVIVADLDLLRNINNTYGHLAGDAVLAAIGDQLRLHLRHYDVASRFGGEEFAVLLPETTCREAREIAERIRESVASTPIWAESARQYVSATLSMGVACFPTYGTDPDDLLHHADLAAYRAKLQGRNRVLRATRRAVLTAVAPEPFLAVLADEGPAQRPTPPKPRPRAVGEPPALVSQGRRWLVPAVALAGVAAGAVAAFFGGSTDLAGLLVIAGLVAVGQALALEVDHGSVSAGAVAALAGAAMFGLRAALFLAAVSVAVDLVLRRTPWPQAFLNLGSRSLSLLLATGIFALGFHGTVGDFVTVALGPIAGAGSFLVSSGLVSLPVALEGRESWWRAWRGRFAWLVPHYVVYGFVAAVAAVAYRGAGLYALAVFGVSLLAIRKTQEAIVSHARRSAQILRHAVEMIETQNNSLEHVNRLLKQRSTSAMESLTGIVDMRDAYTAGHSRRVRDLVLAMGRELGLSEAELDVLGRAAQFHDIGKLTVPDTILLKPGPLSAEEWVVMRRHPEDGARIIGRLGFLDDAVPIIRHHHERIDGKGYPGGLAGDEIPLTARIVHVADAYDSMRTNRVYQAARSRVDAMVELRQLAGIQFCAICVDALEKVLAGGGIQGERPGRDRQVAS